MNFLSTGEKIKRARIYKGITLKELCQKDISISKMSCIENDKIKADEWILQMVAMRLNLDIKYLLFDDIMELENSIKVYEDKEMLLDIDFTNIKERIDYCLVKEYKSAALSFIHILFSEYTKRRKFGDIKNLINLYSEFNNLNEAQEQLYYEDLAKYFLVRRNYSDAITYFNRTRNHIFNYTISSKMNCYIENSILLSISYYLNNQYNESEELLEELLYLEDKIKSQEQIVLVNGLLAVIKKHLNKEYLSYKKLFDSYDDKSSLKYSKINIMMARLYILEGQKDEAISIIKNTTDNVNKDDIYSYIELIISIVKILLDAKEIEKAKMYCEAVLDLSIKLDNHFLIEKSYLYKARLDRVERNLIPWEMNMNLATDVLIKFATVEEKRERYIEMAEMYHVIGEIRESLKYLTLAMNLEKNNDI
ncbi:helix-turn-helix domain-containing protein [uncultured Clostridium sp.]|uniref:helix-turn-helix domain-containing protein n=1 Tax=uncultured Clostridium sp. TaxID=59620 RepID=UPI00261CCC8D|nr:helix-turn-helix transcriptional regulator [uncultured Clostridium sp.]